MTEFKIGNWVVISNGGTYSRYIYQISEIFFEQYVLSGFSKYVRAE